MLQLPIILALVFCTGFDSVPTAKFAYQWSQVAPVGSGCFQGKCKAGQFAMAIEPVAGFNDALFLIGDNTVWRSNDGVIWNSRPKTDWGERYGMQFAYFKDRLWMLGGMRTWDDFRNDIWSSTDGLVWNQVAANAPWSKRRWHSVVAYKDRLWLIGGALSSGQRDKTPTEFLHDVWSSGDGMNWRLESEATPMSAEFGLSVFVFRNRIFAASGNGKVWSSEDGKVWNLIAHDLPWSGNGGGMLVYRERIWVLGGSDRNDVWSSPDGKKWECEFTVAPWSKRNTGYSVVFKDRVLLLSGKTGREDSWDGAIWAMSKISEGKQ